ncbi:hypothetical protein TIFTF001_032055 [Ficus carica]|uniref:Uncharacterized protein n=1 Tax=Ficus carica TaxID=3494 RepID=A0AA88J1Y0_FICCA|nr:hypothetical protein TIFTF001_032055 [Ficus carica]
MDPDRVDEDRDAALVFYGLQPLLFEGTRRTVSLASWLYDMESIFRICHIEARLQVSLASKCPVVDARLWWMTLGERAMSSRAWADFRALMIACYGPLPNEDADMPYRDPDIYRDMYLERYFSYVADWHTYPHESKGHYCRRFQEAMLPHVLQDLGSPELWALHVLRGGLPPEIRRFVPAPLTGMTVGNMINDIMEVEIIAHMMQADAFADDYQVPVDDAGIEEPLFEAGLLFHDDPIPAVPLQEIPPQEAEADIGADDQDPADVMAAPDDQPEDPLVIVIDGDDDEEDIEEEFEEEWEEFEGIEVDMEDFEDDLGEILFNNGDWDVDSDASSVVTIEYMD